MAKEVNKTNQVGVRFDKDLLEGVISGGLARSPQMALNLYEKSYLELVDLKVKNSQLKNEKQVEEDAVTKTSENIESPSEEKDTIKPKEESRIAKMVREQREKNLNTKK